MDVLHQLSEEASTLAESGAISDAQHGVLKVLLDFDPAELELVDTLPEEICAVQDTLAEIQAERTPDWDALDAALHCGVSSDGDGGSDAMGATNPSAPCHFWLIRHGERADSTRGVEAEIFFREVQCGYVWGGDAPLTEQGVVQARAGAAALASHFASRGLTAPTPLQYIHSSPLQRCALTAAAYSAQLGVPLKMTPALGTICAAVEQRGGRFILDDDGWVRVRTGPAWVKKARCEAVLSPAAIRTLVYQTYGDACPMVDDDAHDRVVDESFDAAIFERLASEARAAARAAGRAEAHVACCTHREGLRTIVRRLTGGKMRINYCHCVHVRQDAPGGRLVLVDANVPDAS
jgi:broad specificity phosphatase PhoE